MVFDRRIEHSSQGGALWSVPAVESAALRVIELNRLVNDPGEIFQQLSTALRIKGRRVLSDQARELGGVHTPILAYTKDKIASDRSFLRTFETGSGSGRRNGGQSRL
ncbi:hypothetical protein, partial [Citricoccus nitrophenolicus]|uniref:hypothetical protein n=1 Tax=Citricoccus nitrophenolicus TaxID=863575 RepID=UPI0036125CE8